MTLKKYLSKRDLEKSKEPTPRKVSQSSSSRFVVQKHYATRLHYDFRLECRGVLLSWAVPKGPSMNPKDKRLAVHVEDHPIEYQYFEGTIPKGNYGAGKVEIWDKGTFTVPNTENKKELEVALTEGLKKGHFSIVLFGDKLSGEFIFQKLKKGDPVDTSWLIIKKGDDFSRTEEVIVSSKKVKMPTQIAPMLATLVDNPFTSEDWLFEIKWDGFRALAYLDGKRVKLESRNRKSLNGKFPEMVNALSGLKAQVILDGELVILDKEGKSSFQQMQNYQTKSGSLFYYLFDLLYKDGRDLRDLPLLERKQLLKDLIEKWSLPYLRFSDHVLKEGESFYKAASKAKLEGIIGKKVDSFYQSKRSRDWVKIKTAERQEVVIGGFTAPKGSRKKFGALLVGVYDKDKNLKYAGKVGGGFNDTSLNEVYKTLEPLTQKESPFVDLKKKNALTTWVRPKLIAEVTFSEWTKGSFLRHPVFQGLREDKEPKSVVKEEPAEDLSNLDKIYWPKEKITKGDLLNYYEGVAPYILPYLKNRPIMLHRYPEGVEGEDFYQKDLPDTRPKWVKVCPILHEGKPVNYLLISDVRSLLYAINLGSIEVHIFLSTRENLDHPTFCLLDLDPQEIPFDKVVEVAQEAHHLLESLGVKHFCKTSGGKGLHILIPINNKYTYDESRQFAELIAHYIHQKYPTITSLHRNPKKREKKIYLDCLQNRKGQTLVAPYAVRPRPYAPVSTPLEWTEVKKDLDITKYTIKTTLKRLKQKGDLLRPLLGPGINMQQALKKLQKLI